ncbi:MAG: nucleotidyltransferase family protein [Deltaproteobacteria bacterium]|nr:nucleotidyltransferase family protein [Deltaproteobacteria bacterium]
MLLAAGLGTRLRPLTDCVPKPVVPLLDRPLASYGLEHLARAGVREVVANTHHLASVVRDALGAEHVTPAGPVTLAYSHEPEILGTAGGIAKMLSHVGGETFVVVNGDVLFAPDLERAVAHHRATGALATLVVRRDPQVARYGAVEVDASGIVHRIVGRGRAAGAAVEPFMFTGVHVMEPDIARELPERGCIVKDVYAKLLERGAPLAAHVEDADWRDLGTIASYLETTLALASGALAWPSVVPRRDAPWVAPSARIGLDATLARDVVVGERAHVQRGRIAHAVVWPDAVVAADVRDAVAFGEGRIASAS